MAERRAADHRTRKAEFDDYVREVAADGATGEIAKAKRLLDEGAITNTEFEQIKRKALA